MSKMTKEQLEKMSDFEINKAIAEKLELDVSSEQWMHLSDRDENIVIIDTSSNNSRIANRTFDTIDYCNNWADMGLLIDEMIASAWRVRIGPDFFETVKLGVEYILVDKQPKLRAAAIVYLLMREA